MDQFKDYYSILDVDADASAHAIREAYREKIHDLHPDRGGGEEEYEQVKEAYDVLSDPEERQRYDEVYYNYNEDWGFSDQTDTDEDEQDDDPVMDEEPDWREQRQKKPKPLFPEWSGWKKVAVSSLIVNLVIAVLFLMGITEVSDAQQEVQNVRTQEEAFLVQIDELEEENQRLSEEIDAMTADIVRLEEELTSAEDNATALEEENEALIEDIRELEEALAEAREEAETAAEAQTDTDTTQTFLLGSDLDTVVNIMGEPDEITDERVRYGRSVVYLDGTSVVGWSDVDASLAVSVITEGDADTFSEGSTEGEVASAMGTPNAVRGNTWTYGLSTVTFENGQVSSFENTGNLAVD